MVYVFDNEKGCLVICFFNVVFSRGFFFMVKFLFVCKFCNCIIMWNGIIYKISIKGGLDELVFKFYCELSIMYN